MRPAENIRRFIDKATVSTDPHADKVVLDAVLRAHEQTMHKPSVAVKPSFRSIVMRSPHMKLAAAAAVLSIVGIGLIGIWHNGGATAYAFVQTVEAMQGKRSFHIQTYFQQRRHDEFWAEFDKQGNLVRFRQEEDPTPNGPMITIWENGILNRYSPRRNLHQYSRLPNTEYGLEGLEQFDPETIVQEIHALVEAGKAVMETDPLARYTKLMTLRVTRKNKSLKQVLVVNPVTKFVVRVDDYWGGEEGGVFHHGIEVLEYNEAMDPRLFVPDFPQDAILMDQVTQEVGMAQGNMTEKEVAEEVVRQALETWAQKDYPKAGKLFGGLPPEWFAQFDDIRPVHIISIGEAEPIEDEDRPPYQVRCQYETERNGRKWNITLGLAAFDVDGQPGRWHASMRSRDEAPANAEPLNLDGTDLGMVQGQLRDEDVAVAVVRQFFESFQAGDYDAARRLVPPGAAADVKENFSAVKLLRIVSIGPATLIPSRGNKMLAVPCTLEYEEDGQKNSITLKAIAAQHGDRWLLSDLED